MKWTGNPPARMDGEALRAELVAAGVQVDERSLSFEVPEGGTAASLFTITVPDGTNTAVVSTVVAAHTGTPLPRTKARNDAQSALNGLLPKAVAGTTLAPADLQVIARHYVLNNAQ